MKREFYNCLGSAAASAAVRRALASNTVACERMTALDFARNDANDEGVVGCTRGGRAPQFQIG
jgi:hypothetical protein